MSKKPIIIVLAAFFLASCSTQQAKKNSVRALAIDKSMIVGIWAMIPFNNGIANVVEYTSDGKSLLHPFNCAQPRKANTELSDYTISDDGQWIHVKSPTHTLKFQVLEFTGKTMKLNMRFSDVEFTGETMKVDTGASDLDLTFNYAKSNSIAPLCVIYDFDKAETARRTPYQTSDFVPAPEIPARRSMDRYVGVWKDEKGVVQLTIVRGPGDAYYLYKASDDDWNYLYNDVHWVEDALHFQGYVYSDKQELFHLPDHKLLFGTIFQPTVDDTKMRYSKIIDLPILGERRVDTLLTRVID